MAYNPMLDAIQSQQSDPLGLPQDPNQPYKQLPTTDGQISNAQDLVKSGATQGLSRVGDYIQDRVGDAVGAARQHIVDPALNYGYKLATGQVDIFGNRKPVSDLEKAIADDTTNKVRAEVDAFKESTQIKNWEYMKTLPEKLKKGGMSHQMIQEEFDKNKSELPPQVAADIQAQIDAMKASTQGSSVADTVVTDPTIQELENRNRNMLTGQGNSDGSSKTAEQIAAEDPDNPANQNNSSDPSKSLVYANAYDRDLPWYDNQAFLHGMRGFGLALLKGGNLGDAFEAGYSYYDQESIKQQRLNMVSDLQKRGVPQENIHAWLYSGKPEDLDYTHNRYDTYRAGTGELVQRDLYSGKETQVLGAPKAATPAIKSYLGTPVTYKPSSELTEGQNRTRELMDRARYNMKYLPQRFNEIGTLYGEDGNRLVNRMLDSMVQNEDGMINQTLLQEAKEHYPQIYEYASVISGITSPFLRRDSGATITNPETRRELMESIPRPSDRTEEQRRKFMYLNNRILSGDASIPDEEGANAKQLRELVNKGFLTGVYTGNDGYGVIISPDRLVGDKSRFTASEIRENPAAFRTAMGLGGE